MPGSARWLQSYSGVRAKVGLGPSVEPEDEVFAFRHAYCYALSRLQAHPVNRLKIVLARDPRPTGEALARAQAAGLASACRDLGVDLDLIDLGIVTTPVWQHSVRLFEAHGGVMITASHNPLEDNGWKYATGVETFAVDPAPPGALLSAAEMGNLIRAANAFAPQPVRSPLAPIPDSARREEAIAHYVKFVAETYYAHASGAKVVLDPNGGAACGIGEEAFRALGVEPVIVNSESGEPAHEVDVEQLRADGSHVLHALADRVKAEGALFGLAYDFDADRGNLTYVDQDGHPQIPSPQQAAAINTAIALAVHRRSGDPKPAAVVASDATSFRVHQIARAFGAEVFEVETGEINVVTMMRDLEARGLRAVVGVEGPNGGTIFAGTTCRDGTLVGAGALLAAADGELREIISEILTHDSEMGTGIGGLINDLPKQRTFAEKLDLNRPQASTSPLAGEVGERSEPGEGWARTVDRLDSGFRKVFEERLSSDWDRFEIVYSYTRYVGPDRPRAAGYGWKARVSRQSSPSQITRQTSRHSATHRLTDSSIHPEEGFLWIRGSKTEQGVLRLVGDGPDEASARKLLEVGKMLVSR